MTEVKAPSIIPLEIVRAEKSRRRLADFFRYGWHVLEEETPLDWNWHLDAMCDGIQAVLEDWIEVKRWQKREETARVHRRAFEEPCPIQRAQNFLGNVPPGSSKSRIFSVYTLPWMWLRWPSFGAIFLSANPRVALRDALYCRTLLESDWYRDWFDPQFQLRGDQNAISNYGNTMGGSRLAFGWFSRITGDRKDALFIDDPHDAEEVESDVRRHAVIAKWDAAIGNRVNDLRHSPRFGVMQRLHQNDWGGHVLSSGEWQPLIIPMEFEPGRLKDAPDYAKDEIPRHTFWGFSDPRTLPGELLDTRRFPPSVVESEKRRLGHRASGQLQQRPSPLEGGIWKRKWWGYWVPEGVVLPPVTVPLADGSVHVCEQVVLPFRMEFSLQSWDMAFGKSETSSMVVGQVWGLKERNRFLLDQVRDQLDFVETKAAVGQLSLNWPDVETKLIENKANGPAIISSLKSEISGILAIEPDGDKVARAMAEQGTIESGHVFLPHPGLFSPEVALRLQRSHPHVGAMVMRALMASSEREGKAKRPVVGKTNFVLEFVDESTNFPRGAFKDIVDTASQALNRIRKYIRDRDALSEIPGSSSGFSI